MGEVTGGLTFSPAFSGGLIEAVVPGFVVLERGGFSPAFSGGLIEAFRCLPLCVRTCPVFPRVQRGPH